MDERKPCRWCGGMNRNYDPTLTATVFVQPDMAQPGMTQPAIPADALDAADTLEDAGFDVTWLQLSEDGAWMVRVHDRQGRFVGGSIQDDPQSAILAVAEDLLPPSQR